MCLFSSDNNAAQTPHHHRIDALGLFRENPPCANDDVSPSVAAATRLVDWGRDRKEVHSFDSNKEAGGGGRRFVPLKAAAAAAQKPPNGKPGTEVRRERKGLRREEDMHSAWMLECRYLQWRFANARARAVDCARTKAAEKTVCNISCKLQELRDSVMKKRMELEQLKRLESLRTIVEAQVLWTLPPSLACRTPPLPSLWRSLPLCGSSASCLHRST